MKVGFAQINTTVGEIGANADQILAAYRQLVRDGAEVVLTPELALTGYPPQDLMFRSRFVPDVLKALHRLRESVDSVPLLVGYVDHSPYEVGKPFVNACAILARDRDPDKIFKTLLPTYDVFDEGRYFEPFREHRLITLAGKKVGITICEDVWTESYLPADLYTKHPVETLVEAGAEVILNLSSSPFTAGKPLVRRQMLSEIAKRFRIPIYYCNAVGANDELIFDGNSLVVAPDGTVVAQLAGFQTDRAVLDYRTNSGLIVTMAEEAEIYEALVLGVRDYFAKCGFRTAVLGLSGGIDSAVTAAIATAALGREQVTGVLMPSQYSSRGSLEDAEAVAENLGMAWQVVPIKEPFEVFKSQFKEAFHGKPEDITEENMQSRLRGMTLMAFSNKFGHLLLTTGNKSELAVGYCTIYGDMCGGLAVISDVPKTMVYRLARYINRDRVIIPENTIAKAPSAELKPDQKDQDTLPPYEVLDIILNLYVEKQLSPEDIAAQGFSLDTVRWIQRKVDANEYKRRQAAIGLKVTSSAFGIGWRMPIAQRYSV